MEEHRSGWRVVIGATALAIVIGGLAAILTGVKWFVMAPLVVIALIILFVTILPLRRP